MNSNAQDKTTNDFPHELNEEQKTAEFLRLQNECAKLKDNAHTASCMIRFLMTVFCSDNIIEMGMLENIGISEVLGNIDNLLE